MNILFNLLGGVFVFTWLVIGATIVASVVCIQSTVVGPDGKMMICMTCCVADGQCQTTCN